MRATGDAAVCIHGKRGLRRGVQRCAVRALLTAAASGGLRRGNCQQRRAEGVVEAVTRVRVFHQRCIGASLPKPRRVVAAGTDRHIVVSDGVKQADRGRTDNRITLEDDVAGRVEPDMGGETMASGAVGLMEPGHRGIDRGNRAFGEANYGDPVGPDAWMLGQPV